jgi:heme-degrading monooxygenase HmoA
MEPRTYLCTVTRMRVRNPLVIPMFVVASMWAAIAARRTPGNVRTWLLGMPPFPVFWTLSVWESREALDAFAGSPAHRYVMQRMPKWAARGRFTTFTTDTRRVGWLRAARMLREPDALWTPKVRYRRNAQGELVPVR